MTKKGKKRQGGRRKGSTKFMTPKDILLKLWEGNNKGELYYKDLTDSFGVTTSTISQQAHKLEEKGCIELKPGKRGRMKVVLNKVNWDTLKCIVEIFKKYQEDYIKLMKTDFGDLVVDFLLNEIRKLDSHLDFEDAVLYGLNEKDFTYLERNLEEFVKEAYIDKKVHRLAANLLKKLGFLNGCISGDPIVVLFSKLLKEAIKRQIRHKLDKEVIELGVKYNYHFLEFMVKCYDGTFSQKYVDKLSKLALAVLSIPPVFYAKMWENIKEHILNSYITLIHDTTSEKDGLSEKSGCNEDKNNNHSKDELRDKKTESEFQKMSDFELTFGGLGYLLYKNPMKVLELLLDRPELLNSLHAIGFLFSSPNPRVSFMKYLLVNTA